MYEIQLDLTHSANCAGDSDRMPRFTLFLLLIVLFLAKFSAASALSPCVGHDIHEWDNCEGAHFLANGDRYIGEWKNGKKHGRGMYYFTDGAIYAGEYVNDFMNGRGTMFWADGRIWVGTWKDRNWVRGQQYQPGKAPGYVYEAIASPRLN